MIVVADSGPLHYLVLLQQVELLPRFIDETAGRAEARRRHLQVTGTLGILRAAAEEGLIDVADVVARLRSTNFEHVGHALSVSVSSATLEAYGREAGCDVRESTLIATFRGTTLPDHFMARSASQLLAEALDLPLKERAHLAESLISSLDEDVDDVDPAFLEREWMSEVSKRASEIDSGSVQTESAVEVFRAARAEL